jgi:hypothetical protein
MALWSNSDANTSAPKYAVAGGLGVASNGETLFENETIDAYVADAAIGVFGVTNDEKTSEITAQHSGWILKKQGTGPVVSITANTGAYSPDGNVYITFTGGGAGNTSANAQITVNSVSKLITGITLNSGGEYLTTPTAAAVNANAAFTITMGGRANRPQSETLVAMNTIS